MRRDNKNLIFLVIFLILGMAMAMQFRSVFLSNSQKESQSLNDVEKLKSSIKNEKELGEKLKKQVDEKEKEREENLKNTILSNNDSNLREIKQQLDQIKLKAGLTDVQGDGVVVTLDDAEARISEDESSLIIHDMDLVKVLNELKKAGAQAIAVNNERVMSLTEQMCAGPTIRINNRKYSTPFEIKAVGDPDSLYKGVSESEIIYLMLKDKIRVDIKKAGNMIIPKYVNDNIGNLFSGLEVSEQ